MLRGTFDTDGRPYKEGRLLIPRLRIASKVSFLVDTGADSTTLLPADASRMGVKYEDLIQGRHLMIGIGGTAPYYTEESIVIFDDPANFYLYKIDLQIVAPDEHVNRLPSLLGRDILNKWQMVYSPTDDSLTFQVKNADQIVPTSRPGS